MKKTWIISFVFVLSLTGCQSKVTKVYPLPESVNPPFAQVNLDKPIDREIISEDLIGNFKYLDKNIESMSVEDATDRFFKLEELSIKKQFYYVDVISHDKDIQNALMKCFDETNDTFDFTDYDGGNGMFINEIYASGYKLVPYEGVVYPVTDYSKFKPYATFMTDEVQSYICIKSLESEAYTGTRSALEISQADLEERILLAEDHIVKYENGKTYPIVLEMYKAYMYYYIPSSVIFEEELNINEERIAVYKSFVDAHPDTIAAQIVSDYLLTLKDNNYEKNEVVKAYFKDFYCSIDTYIAKATSGL